MQTPLANLHLSLLVHVINGNEDFPFCNSNCSTLVDGKPIPDGVSALYPMASNFSSYIIRECENQKDIGLFQKARDGVRCLGLVIWLSPLSSQPLLFTNLQQEPVTVSPPTTRLPVPGKRSWASSSPTNYEVIIDQTTLALGRLRSTLRSRVFPLIWIVYCNSFCSSFSDTLLSFNQIWQTLLLTSCCLWPSSVDRRQSTTSCAHLVLARERAVHQALSRRSSHSTIIHIIHRSRNRLSGQRCPSNPVGQ